MLNNESIMKKVLYVLSSTLEYGGASKSFLTMLKGLMEHGVNPIVVVPDNNGMYGTLAQMNLKLMVMPLRPNVFPRKDTFRERLLFVPRLFGRLLVNTLAVRKLYRMLKEEQINLVHSNVGVIDVGWRLSRKLGIPHVYHIREYGDLDFKLHRFHGIKAFKAILRMDNSWSIFITKALRTYYDMDENPRSKVIYNPVCVDAERRCSTERKGYFLYAGRLDKGKGIYDLVRAYIKYASEVPNPLKLYVAGDSNRGDMQTMSSMIKEAGLDDRVCFLGYCKNVDVLMREARAIVITSYNEAFGRCLAEAMFNKCLTIGRNTGGTREQYDNGVEMVGREIGLRFSSVDELVEKMKIATNMTTEDVESITCDALQVVSSLYTNKKNVTQVLDLYNQMVGDALC